MTLSAFWWSVIGGLIVGVLTTALSALLFPLFFRGALMKLIKPILSTDSERNVAYQTLALPKTIDPLSLLQIMVRGQTGEPFNRPMGAARRARGLDQLHFLPAQISRLPTLSVEDVDTSVTIGPNARRPLRCRTPIIIAGMGYGVALSERAKAALAEGAQLAGAALNSGCSGYLPQERTTVDRYIVQYNRAGWGNAIGDLRQADAVEIVFGRGASGGVSESTPVKNLPARFRQLNQVTAESGEVRMESQFETIKDGHDLRRVIDWLRDETDGLPIGVKLAAGDIEADLEEVLVAEPDFLTIDGAEAGGEDGYAITAENFGLPTVFAIPRADRYLRRRKIRDRISLIASGGLHEPGDFLKAIALGADAVAIGTAALLVMVHAQALKVYPKDPPLTLVLPNTENSDRFDLHAGARRLANFIKASTKEMAIATGGLGHRGLSEVSAEDLCAFTGEMAVATGAQPAYEAPRAGEQGGPPDPEGPREKPVRPLVKPRERGRAEYWH
ncbi:MAG TPA: FMN-binding glutamate synthase family protein [Bacillota bacterium]